MSVCFVYFLSFLLMGLTTFLFSLNFMLSGCVYILEFDLVSLNSCSILMTVLFDWVSLLFMSFVMFISSMVIFYSDEYMLGDLNINRFIFLVVLFVFSMMFMIMSPNLISILLGWDGLGLVSYCLVIYYQNVKSYNAGMITALSNRIGDVSLLMAIAWMMNFGSFNYFYMVDYYSSKIEMKFIFFLVILAALTKSAQIPFSTWLPAAMSAPTPVSSLVHSSTLVTAGVYLLIRFNFGFSYYMMMILLFVGSLTMFMAGLGANYEFDLKKIIALSTLSQLGLMMSILSLGSYQLAFYHLLTHALFKALLFMCAGCMIHNLCGMQDIRFMGGLINLMPLTCSFFIISNMSLCGIPFLAGFYSKDLILEVISLDILNFYIYIIFFISTGLTVAYTFRLIYYVIVGDLNFLSLNLINDEGKVMLKGMSGLILLVVFGGSLLMWLMFPVPYFICLPLLLKNMTLFVVILGMYMGYELSKFSLSFNNNSLINLDSSLYFSGMWNMPFLSTFGMNYFPLFMGNYIYKNIDQGWSEYFGSQNIYNNMKSLSQSLFYYYNNNLKIYLLLFIFWILFLFIYF